MIMAACIFTHQNLHKFYAQKVRAGSFVFPSGISTMPPACGIKAGGESPQQRQRRPAALLFVLGSIAACRIVSAGQQIGDVRLTSMVAPYGILSHTQCADAGHVQVFDGSRWGYIEHGE